MKGMEEVIHRVEEVLDKQTCRGSLGRREKNEER